MNSAEIASNNVGTVAAAAEELSGSIRDISRQMARAREAGKGFAVVASEVKNLAAQTAKATDEIQTQVAGIQAETSHVVATIGGISGTNEQISEIATSVAAFFRLASLLFLVAAKPLVGLAADFALDERAPA